MAPTRRRRTSRLPSTKCFQDLYVVLTKFKVKTVVGFETLKDAARLGPKRVAGARVEVHGEGPIWRAVSVPGRSRSVGGAVRVRNVGRRRRADDRVRRVRGVDAHKMRGHLGRAGHAEEVDVRRVQRRGAENHGESKGGGTGQARAAETAAGGAGETATDGATATAGADHAETQGERAIGSVRRGAARPD